MTHLKLLTALTALALLTACGGATPTATGDPSQTTDCAANPFGASCIAEDINVEARITDCITAGNAGDTKCASLTSDTAMNTAINTCLTNPFDESCTASDFTFSTYAEMARTNRVSFCETAGNETDALCPTLVRNCIANPFGATCGAYFESAKASYCMTNDVVACPNATYADWLDSFTGTLATAPASTHTANQFLSGLTATLPTFPANFALGSGDRATSLTLADNGFGGDAADGASFFSGSFNAISYYYAGIHASTDLGAPLDNISQAGIWKGWIRLDGRFPVDQTFDLTVTFNTASQGGTIAAFFGVGSPVFLDIDGAFNDKGVITTGTIVLGTSGDQATIAVDDVRTPGILTGLIGQQGAVGAFISTTNTINNNDMLGSYPYTGAFVAVQPPPPDPCVKAETCVNTADWLASFTGGDALTTTPDATPTNEFLAITETTASSLTAVVPTTLFMSGISDNGLAFFTENGAYYAGVLAGTNLGAPITETITSARWTGQIRADSSDSAGVLTANPTDGFGLDITFGGTGTGGTMKTIAIVPIRNTVYEIDGMFDANGIITGTVDFGGTVSAGSSVVDTSHASYSPGTLSGIIGQNGAVGVFHSDNANPEAGLVAALFSGGFFVTPPK